MRCSYHESMTVPCQPSAGTDGQLVRLIVVVVVIIIIMVGSGSNSSARQSSYRGKQMGQDS